MRIRPVLARLANIAGAFAAFLGLAVIAHLAMASGIEGAGNDAHLNPQSEAQAARTYLDAPALRTPVLHAPALLIGASAAGTPAPASNACISLEEAYRIISATTEGEDIGAINTALNEAVRNPAGPAADEAESPLAGRLRAALNLTGSAPPCETVLLALSDAVQLAQVASTADATNPTGAVGEPSPLSPVSYLYIPPGGPSGDGGWGYRVGHD